MDVPKKMKALVCHGPGDIRLQEVDTPIPGPGEILVKVLATGICASDIKCYLGAPLFWGDEHRAPYMEAPSILGHEFIGEVVMLGDGAADRHGVKEGDLVVSEQIVPCWKCRYCRTGRYWLCQRNYIYGFKKATQGSWAEYMKFPADAIVHKVPKGVDPSKGAMIEPLSCSIHAVERGDIRLGDVVVIAGAGTLGLGMVAVAKLKGPGLLIAVDMKDYRLQVAKALGADLTINPSKEDPVERVLELTDGYGCDVYIEATGHPSGVIQGLRMIRKLGTFVEFSVMAEEVTVDWTIIGDSKELNIHGAHLGPYLYPLAIEYIAKGVVDVSPIITHKFKLEDFSKAIEMVHKGEESIKALFIP
jgi:threonine dehydrogenase-like Zn-dependent dehydrogenase